MKRSGKVLGFVMLGCLGLFMLATSSCSKDSAPAKMTLYDTMGGTKIMGDPANSGAAIEKGRLVIRSIVDSAIFVIAADSRINGYFTVLLGEVGAGNTSGFEALSKNLTDFFCVATGAADYRYTGKRMHDAHDPTMNSRMNGTADSTDFDIFVADVVAAAQKNMVNNAVIARLGTIIYSVEGQVVQR